MAYRETTRQMWLSVADNKCQYEYYTERRGWQTCGARATHVHHLLGERDLLEAGEDPENSPALPLCKDHHVKNTGENLGEFDSSFHPDMGQAYTDYKEWKRQQEHLKSISGKRTTDYSTSPFAEAARGHTEAIKNGERYINGDWRTDAYYIQKMRGLLMLYLAQHPEGTRNIKPHPHQDKTKTKRWWNLW